MPEFKNILVVRTDRIGDVILTVPAIRALKKAFPAARVTVWVSGSIRALVDGLPFIDEVLVEDTSKGWLGYFQFLSLLRRKKFDLAVVYHTKKRVNAACFLSGIPDRLGYKNEKFGFLLNHPVTDERSLGKKHEVEYCVDLLKAIDVPADSLRLEMAFQREAETWAAAFVRDYFPGTGPLIALHPDASCPTRHWPVESFSRLAQLLHQELGARLVILGAGTATKAAIKIQQSSGVSVVDLTGKTSMEQMKGFIKRADFLISNDSGPVHMAAAIGTPVISLFLRQQPGINPERWRPLGEKAAVLFNKPGEEIIIDRHSRVLSGRFDSITPEEVLATVKRMLG